MARGRLNFSSGSRVDWTAADSTFRGLGAGVNVLPQTRQRVAFSLNRVPQVGHTFDEGVLVSEVMFSLFQGFQEP